MSLQLASNNYSFEGSPNSNFSSGDLSNITYRLTSVNPNKSATDLSPFINANGELLGNAYGQTDYPTITQTYYYNGETVGSRKFVAVKASTNFTDIYDNDVDWNPLSALPAATLTLKKTF
jgi:hypothetical protein